MPHMTGIDLAAEILKIRPDIPVVLTSGYVGEQEIETVQRLGVTQLIPKPSTVEEVGQIVHRVISQRRKA